MSKSKTIWAIEQGCYSDYHVVGVFTAKENADYICSKINTSENYNKATVSAWPLDPAIKELRRGLSLYMVQMQKDGTTDRCDVMKFSGYTLYGSAVIWRRSQAPAYRDQGIQDVLVATVWAKGQKHAVKTANEHRIRMIADGTWDADIKEIPA